MRARLKRLWTPAALVAGVGLAAAATAPARPAPASQLKKPSPPAVQPNSGRAFVPIQGDWEGTAAGFAASFNLVLDAVHRQSAGTPTYGIQDLVVVRPAACPPTPARSREVWLRGNQPSVLGAHGSLGLDNLGLHGGLTGARAGTLAISYFLPACHGTLTWHMHPAVRRLVADGRWTLRYADGERTTFHVQSGGRLATGIRLPHSILACNGLQGTLDAFVGIGGGAILSHSGVTFSLRFANERARGTLTARGCGTRPSPVTAVRTGG